MEDLFESLSLELKTLTNLVVYSTPSSDVKLLAPSAQKMIRIMKQLWTSLAPNGSFESAETKQSMDQLKANILKLLKLSKSAFGRSQQSLNNQVSSTSRVVSVTIEQVKSNLGLSKQVKKKSSSKSSMRIDNSTSTQVEPVRTRGRRGGGDVAQTRDRSGSTVASRRNLLRAGRKSISLAKENVQVLLDTMDKARQSESGRRQSMAMDADNQKLLTKVLGQIDIMEKKMSKMERDIKKEEKNVAISPIAASKDETELSSMIFTLQQALKDTEEAREREQRLVEMEKRLIEKEKQLEERENAMMSRFEKMMDNLDIDKLDEKLKKLERFEEMMKSGAFMGGGMSMRGYEELKKELEELQKVIFDDSTSEKDKAAANIKLEKVMRDIERTSEFQEEQRKQKEAWKKENEPKNKSAYERVFSQLKREYQSGSAAFREKMEKKSELALVLISPDDIKQKHESDFRNYVLDLSEAELRAIFHNLPTFRPDQETQKRFVETLRNKIDQCSKGGPPPPPAVKRTGKKWKPKKAPSGGGGGGGFLGELLQKTRKLN